MDETKMDDLFLDKDPTTYVPGALAPVVLVAGSKGGAGATTVAITIAELARTSGGVPRVTLVDADPTNSHIATYLRAKTSGQGGSVPTILDGALRKDYRRAVAQPGIVNAGHSARVPDISMHTVLAPPTVQYDPTAVSASSYSRALKLLQPHFDLVVVDIGTLNAHTPTALQEAFAYPALRTGGWLFLVSNSSRLSVQSAMDTARLLDKNDVVNSQRIFSMINARRGAVDAASVKTITERMTQFSTPLGAVDYDEEGIGNRMESGHIPSSHHQMVASLSEALHTITNYQSFADLASGKRKPGERGATVVDSSRRRRLIPSLGR
ncbi:ParA family protein [Ornithinimicrobium murale]|uniref:ParA family protein n=1 Tax=Ornithinimicrobium murale TaxID=1050153 RepID=UPI000E0D1898|nr:ParA family protein [Ornithinimicrobium murale]